MTPSLEEWPVKRVSIVGKFFIIMAVFGIMALGLTFSAGNIQSVIATGFISINQTLANGYKLGVL
ncbi:hypothetical protein GFL96_35850 [Rhizobium leguminosarum bv. viciae]|nr:hypothetical protein [Rhizobium leguminosarum bv. viciae]